MTRYLKIFNIILVALLLVTLGYILGKKYTLAYDQDKKLVIIKNALSEEKLRRIFNLIDNQYVENVNTDSLLTVTLNGMLLQLDPHSMYLSANNYTHNLAIESSYQGIGIQYQNIRDTLTITRIYHTSLRKNTCWIGDKIISVNGKSATEKTTQETIFPLSEMNYKVVLLRNKQLITVQLPKTKIEIPAVQSYFMIDKTTGYIKLDRFSKTAVQEVRQALVVLQKLGMKKLIFDLRDNPGGLLDEAEKIADEFLPKGKLMVYTENKDKKKEYIYATASGIFENKPIYVLINENSASASEVVAGALQDNDAAIIVGRRSFGKGLVQREIDLGDGSKLRLTTAHYYTPTGRNIQKPYKNQKEYYASDMIDRIYNGELYDKSKIKVIDSLKKKTPKGKIVFGGGGITPDVFVSMQQFEMSYEFYEQAGFMHTQDFMLNYIQQHEKELKTITENQFIHNFSITSLLSSYQKFMLSRKIQLNVKQHTNILTFIKAHMARILYGENAYYKIWHKNDNTLQEALKLATKNT